MIGVLYFTVSIIILIFGPIILQFYLSGLPNKKFGLILPSLSFIFSIICVMSIAFPANATISHILVTILSYMFIMNIPTIILMCIYWISRHRINKQSEMDKMNIKDL